MNRFLKTAVLAAAVGATTLAAMPAAEARDHWRRHHHHRGGDAVAAGVIGLAAGAIIGGALAQPRYREPVYDDYYEPRRVRRYEYIGPAYREPVYVRGSLEPWSRDWYRYCENRYRSFDARTGTFMGYDGREHFCTAN